MMLTVARSLSEFGCITNKRQFNELGSLYSDKMTSVYSGGLVYEYSEEGTGYGLVKISGNSVTETAGFSALANQLSQNKAPSGDGGYKSDGQPSQCPGESTTWEVKDFQGEDLPAIPKNAEQYIKSGAGKGPGLSGSGSQNAGEQSTGTAKPGSGSVTTSASGSPTSSKGAASSVFAAELGATPFICTALVMISSLLGAGLML
jgi:hypothetical protein